MQKVNDIRKQLLDKFNKKEFTGNTIELIGATFIADEPEIFGFANPEWYERELQWYDSKSLNVNDIPGKIPAIWKQVATPDGFINSNYGWMIFSQENGSQYCNALKKLKSDRNTRQAQMIYTRPFMHTDWNSDGKHDFCCTAYNQFFIRDDKLVSHYVMRSNDLIFGYRGDLAWAIEVQKRLAKDLDIEVDDIVWTSSSLHIYEPHYYLLDHYSKTGEIAITKENYTQLYSLN